MNELEKRNKKHKRKQHGLSPFNSMNTDAGNVEHNIAMFNNMNSSTKGPCTTPVGSSSGSGGLAESVSWGAYKDFEYINDQYLPATGEGDSKATQAVTAINKLVFKYYNDGDVYDNVHSGLEGWANDISSFANWLYKYVPETRRSLSLVYDIILESEYEDLLFKLTTIVLDEKLLEKLHTMSKVGSVYECDGPFEFSDYVDDEDDDYSDMEDEYLEEAVRENRTKKRCPITTAVKKRKQESGDQISKNRNKLVESPTAHFKVGDKFDYSGLYGGSYTAEVQRIRNGKLYATVSWTAEDTGKLVTSTEVFDITTDSQGMECIITWEYKGHKGYVYPPSISQKKPEIIDSSSQLEADIRDIARESAEMEVECNSYEEFSSFCRYNRITPSQHLYAIYQDEVSAYYRRAKERNRLSESTATTDYLNDALRCHEITQEQFNAARDIKFKINGEDITLFIQGYPYDLSEIESVKYSEYAGKYDGAYEVTTVDGSMIILGWYDRDVEATLYKVTLFEEFLGKKDDPDSVKKSLKETLHINRNENTIDIDYDKLDIFVVTRWGKSGGYFDTDFGNWLPDEDDGYDTTVEYSYTVDKEDVIEVFYYDVESELSKTNPEFYSSSTDDEWYEYVDTYIEDNLESLLKKYESEIMEYFKEAAQEAAEESYNNDLYESKKSQENVNEANYGGAYDISSEEYFTRDDLISAAEDVLDHVNETFTTRYVLGGTWLENKRWIVNIQTQDMLEEYEDSVYVDMRRIRSSTDLKKVYALKLAAQLIQKIKSLNEDAFADWKPNTSFKHIKDLYNKVKENNYEYVNNEREEFLAAVKKADKGGYKPEERKQIRDWHKEIWRAGKSK